MALFGCLTGSLLAIAPRVVLIGAWLVADRWQQVWDGTVLIPLVGIVFLPYTTVMYLLVWTPAGIAGYAWVWLALGLLLDVAHMGFVATDAGEGRRGTSEALDWLRRSTRRTIDVVRGTPLLVWLIFLVALVVRLVGTPYALPQQLDPDEPIFVDGALRMISNGDLDPDWYGAPASTLMTGMAALYAAYGFAGILLGNLGSMADIVPAYQADGTYFLLSGRIYTAIAATAVVVATYAVTRELRVSHFSSGLAALVIALSPLMIGYSWLVRMDMFQVLLMLLALLMVLRALRKPTLTAFVLAGVFVGLGVASKYPAVVVAIPILAAAIVLAGQGRLSIRASIGYLVSAGVASLIAAAVVARYLFIDFEEVLAHVERENRVRTSDIPARASSRICGTT